MSILYCKKCGKQMSSRTGFCVSCGMPITEDCEDEYSKYIMGSGKEENPESNLKKHNVSKTWRSLLCH